MDLLETNELLDKTERTKEYKEFYRVTESVLKEQWNDLIYSGVVILILNSLFKGDIKTPVSMNGIARLRNIVSDKVSNNISSLSKYQEFSIKSMVFLARLANIGGQYELNNFLSNATFNLTNSFYRDKIKDRVKLLITGMDEYTIKKFTNELVKAIAVSKTKKEVILALEKSGKDIVGIRSDNMMRTETSTMLEYMRLQVGKLNGVQYKQWKATLDERTCPICFPLHNQVARIDEGFPGGYYNPGAHAKCRCTMVLSWNIEEFGVQKKYNFYGKDSFDGIILNKPNVNYYWDGGNSFKGKEATKILEIYNELSVYPEENFRGYLSGKKGIEVYSIYSMSNKIEQARTKLSEQSFNSLMFLLSNRGKTRGQPFLNY